jgi:hypothetical protein
MILYPHYTLYHTEARCMSMKPMKKEQKTIPTVNSNLGLNRNDLSMFPHPVVKLLCSSWGPQR